MTTAYPAAIAFAFGQLLAFILILNSSHGIGVNFRHIDRAIVGCLAVAGLVGGGLILRVWGHPWAEWPWAIQLYSIPCLFLCLIGFPTVTILRQFRRIPAEAREVRSETIDLRESFPLDELVGHGPRSKMLRWSVNDSLKVSFSEVTTSFDRLPETLDGLSILHLTDLHFARTYGRRYFEEAVAWAVSRGDEPDLVAITGDFIDDDACIPWIGPILGPLRGRLGKFAVLGNHDFINDHPGLRDELVRAGFEIIVAGWTMLDVDGARLAIGGTTAPWGVPISKFPVPEADFRLLLSHSPDEAYRADRVGADLMLCGHNHGGQVRLPIIGPVLMPSRYSRRFDRGFFRIGKTLMFVGQGLAAKDPLRIGCVPEVVRLTLRARLATSPAVEVEGRDLESLAASAES